MPLSAQSIICKGEAAFSDLACETYFSSAKRSVVSTLMIIMPDERFYVTGVLPCHTVAVGA